PLCRTARRGQAPKRVTTDYTESTDKDKRRQRKGSRMSAFAKRVVASVLGFVSLLSVVSVLSVVPSLRGEDRSAKERTPEQQAALEEGQALFRGLCSGCHGGAGRGGKGPDLTRGKFMHGNRDEDIARVIREGVAKTTMKKLGDSLKEEQITKLVLFIRSLARAPREATWKPYLKGDPAAGRKLFFDEKGQAN